QEGALRKDPAPEGCPRIARRFSAGKCARDYSSPGGTTENSERVVTPRAPTRLGQLFRSHFRLQIFQLLVALFIVLFLSERVPDISRHPIILARRKIFPHRELGLG